MYTRLGTLSLAALCLLGSKAEAAIIDTTAGWNGATSVSSFGETNSATYGQTFTTPLVDTRLDSFTFYLNDVVNPDFVDFGAYVMAWDGAKATGPVLFSSGPLSTNNNGGADGFQAMTINTGGVNLTPGGSYVAFFSASNFFDGSLGSSAWGQPNANSYAGGGFVFQNNGNNFGSLTTSPWDQNFLGTGGDLAFRMEFNAADATAPEPATMLLLGTGLLGVGLSRRRQRQA